MSSQITLTETDLYGERIMVGLTRLVVNLSFAEPATLHDGGEDTDADAAPLHYGGDSSSPTDGGDIHISGL